MGILDVILRRPSKGTGAWEGEDSIAKAMFGRPERKRSRPEKKDKRFRRWVDKEDEYEKDGKAYYRMHEISKSTGYKDEAQTLYLPIEEYDNYTKDGFDKFKYKVFLDTPKKKDSSSSSASDRAQPLAALNY